MVRLRQESNIAWITGKALRAHPIDAPISEKVFAMLVAYIDDSGTHDNSPNTVLAGYWGSVNEWRRFERAWKAVLASEEIDRFHAKDFWPRIPNVGRIGAYKNWSDERHASFIDRLLRVIEDTKITPFACGLIPSEWAKVPTSSVEIVTTTDDPRLQKATLLPFQRTVLRASSYCLPHKVMHFVMHYDQAKPSVQEAMTRMFFSIKKYMDADNDPRAHQIGDLTFATDIDAVQLQAADLLAYEAHRYAKAAKGNKNHPMRSAYRRALSRSRSQHDFWLFDDVRFANIERVTNLPMTSP